jgi:tetratricopeptide (TPR) repeat protein
LLYELLTGRTPFDAKELVRSGLDEMRRTLREEEPQRPSTVLTTLHGTELKATAEHRHEEPPKLISLLKGDLDWIVMRALEKNRARRYETVNGLAMDIQRYLDNEPVVARPPSRLYRFQKLVRRNKVVFAASGAVIAALILGLGASTWMFLGERAARQRAVEAERQQEQLRHEAEAREKITRATVLVNAEKYDEAERLAGENIFTQPTVEGAAVLRALGEWHALDDRWKPAAEYFTRLLQINSLDGMDVGTLDYLECGPALIETGDLAGYERFRRAAIARISGNTYPFGDRILKISLLLPADASVIASLNPIAESAAKSLPTNLNAEGDIFLAAWQSVSLGLFEYRNGNYAQSVKWCRQCLAYPEHNAPRSATARVILAMACWRLGQPEQARTELAQAREVVEAKFNSGLDRGTGVQGFWFDWVFAKILLREATVLIPPAT